MHRGACGILKTRNVNRRTDTTLQIFECLAQKVGCLNCGLRQLENLEVGSDSRTKPGVARGGGGRKYKDEERTAERAYRDVCNVQYYSMQLLTPNVNGRSSEALEPTYSVKEMARFLPHGVVCLVHLVLATVRPVIQIQLGYLGT